MSGRGNVASLPDQGTTGARLKRFAQKLEQFVLVVSAESELCSVFQKYRVLSAEQRLQFFDSPDIDNSRAMHPSEFFRIELCLHRAEGLSHHRSDFACMEVHVFIVGFYPNNFVNAQERNAPGRLDHKAIEVMRLVFDTLQQCAYLRLAPRFGARNETALLHV